jgi:hypothetical protein
LVPPCFETYFFGPLPPLLAFPELAPPDELALPELPLELLPPELPLAPLELALPELPPEDEAPLDVAPPLLALPLELAFPEDAPLLAPLLALLDGGLGGFPELNPPDELDALVLEPLLPDAELAIRFAEAVMEPDMAFPSETDPTASAPLNSARSNAYSAAVAARSSLSSRMIIPARIAGIAQRAKLMLWLTECRCETKTYRSL